MQEPLAIKTDLKSVLQTVLAKDYEYAIEVAKRNNLTHVSHYACTFLPVKLRNFIALDRQQRNLHKDSRIDLI